MLEHYGTKAAKSRDIGKQSTKNKSQSFTSPKPGAIHFPLKPYTNTGMKALSVNCKQSFATLLSKSLFYWMWVHLPFDMKELYKM